MAFWWDAFKLFTYAFEEDPLSRQKRTQDVTGAGVTQPEAIPDIRQDGSFWGGGRGLIRLRDTNDFIDLSTVSNRQSRYREYERLRNVAEIEMAMTVFSDEACQKGDNGHAFKIECKNEEVTKELEFLFYHRNMLNFDRRMWNDAKNLFIMGDRFWELVIDPDNPKAGILKIQDLPAESIYRIETTKGKTVEFQQSKEGPDYESLTRAPIAQATDADIMQSKAIRFAPHQIVHLRIGDDRKNFYPYGQSLVEPARGPAHQLRLMEDAMVVYRLCLTGDTRIRTDKGWKYITDVKIGDIVYCQTSPGIFAKVPVIWWVNNGIQKILKLKTQHTEIRGTLTHPLLVNRNGVVQWVDLQDIKPKQDKLLNVTHDIEVPVAIPKVDGTVYMLRRKYAAEVVNQEKLEKCVKHIVGKSNIDPIKVARNVTLFLKGLNRYGVRKNWLDKISSVFAISEGMVIKTKRKSRTINLPEFVDEDFARFFGFMLGDGSIRRSGHSMCFAASPDANLNKHYSGLMLRYFGSVNFDKEKRSKHIECGNYTVGSTEAVNIMLEMGYICKNKRIPQWVFNAPKNIRRAFVEGISDADGCERFTKAGTWFSTISMSNKELINDIKEVWHGIGLCSGKIKERVRKASYRKSWNRHLPETTTYEITITDRILPTYDTVWSVVPDGEEEVYDFTVDHEGHNFVANGICSMNTRAPERRVFYIDVGQLPPYKAEAFMERLKDLFRKKKVASSTARTQSGAASSVEERWHAPAADEDYWLPIRPNSNTRIDTLPGAQNLGEIDDAVYFRNKLFTALNFPKNYFSSEDVQVTRIALSAQDVRFARQVERLQSHIEDGLWQIADRHLKLRGFPEEAYEDLLIKMTPPSDWRELSRAEVLTNRINNANGLKGSMLWSDYDILTKMMKIPEDEAKGMMSRLKMQKLEDLKLQVLAQNPQLLGVGVPGEGENEVGAESGGPNQMIAPDQAQGPAPEQPQVAASDQGPPAPPEQQQPNAAPLADFTTDELKKYDLQVQTYSLEADREEVDFSQQG